MTILIPIPRTFCRCIRPTINAVACFSSCSVASTSRVTLPPLPVRFHLRRQSSYSKSSIASSTAATATSIPLPNGYTYYANHNDFIDPSSSSNMSSIELPRADQVYTSSLPSPHLPRMSIYHYLFPFKKYKGKHRTRFYYYPEPNIEKISFIDGLTGKFVTRDQVEEQAKRLASGLKALGVDKEKEMVACIFGMNSLEWVNACFGSQAAGMIVSPANYAYTPAELHHQLHDSNACLAYVQPSLLPTFLKALELGHPIPDSRIILLCSVNEKPAEYTDRFKAIEEVWGPPGTPRRFQDGMEERTAYLCYSSGTTGRAKGVETSHHNMTSQVQALNCSYEKLKYNDVVLAVLPFSHIYGLTVTLHQPLTVNGTVVILPRFEELSVLKAVQEYKVTWSLVVPPMIIALLNSSNMTKYDISTLRGFQSGAAPLSSDLIRAWEKKYPKIPITQGYGLTETSPVSNVMNLEEGKRKPGSIGRLIPTYQARLVDIDNDKDIDPSVKDGRGELWLRGPSVMKGYWKNPQATDGVFSKGGWFKTGDVATIDQDGYFYIVDRVKELIKYKGFQVPPAELEALLLTHPNVADVGVIGIYSKSEATELPRAYIVPKKGNSMTEDQIKQSIIIWVQGKVANHKRLRGGVVLIEAIPKSPSGKILRKDLRALAAKDEEEKVVSSRIAKL